jgi:hypothetical protein
MPHQVVKCSVRGSVGDLAKITAALEAEGYNILAIGASEVNHVGMLALIFDPDQDIGAIADTVRGVDLDVAGNRRPEDVGTFPDVHILLNDTPGQLRRAAEAVGDINIETIVSIDKMQGKARVSLSFEDDATLAEAVRRLRAAHIQIHDHQH